MSNMREFTFDQWAKVADTDPLSTRIFNAVGVFRAQLREVDLGGVTMFDMRLTPHTGERTADHVRDDDTRLFGIELQIEGSSVIEQDGVSSTLHPGDYTLYDSTRPFVRHFHEPVRIFVVRFPHNMIFLPAHTLRAVTATRLAADEGIGVVVSPFLKSIADNMEELGGWAGLRVMHSLIDLVSAALAEKLQLADRAHGNPRAQAFLHVCDFIMDNLSDPSLSPDTIAAANFISTRQLHKLFHAEHITVSQWIRDRRLEQCRRQLADPVDANLSVGQIAANWGIYDGAHFSRIFKNAYGLSPRDYRREHAA